MHRATLAWVIAAYIGLPLCAIEPKPKLPKLQLAEVQSIAPVSYHLELTLDPGQPEFTGTIQIALDVKQPARTLWLNATDIAVQEAVLTVAGKGMPAKVVPDGEDFLALEFAKPVPMGAATVRIRYTARVRQDSGGVFRADDSGHPYLWTQFEATLARSAFPCFDEPAYKVPWQLTLHVPSKDRAVSNTPVAQETVNGNTRTYIFQETKPIPSYLVAFAVGPLEFVDAGVAGKNRVPVRIVVPQGRRAEAKYAAGVSATILARLEDYFGVPYPYEKLDEIAIPVGAFGGMENAGLIAYGQSILLARPEADSLDRQRGFSRTAAHEMAHQWFGDLVTLAWWNDAWLNEAFATWMERKLLAAWMPEWKSQVEDVQYKRYAEQQDALTTARKIRQEIVTKGDISNAFDDITYQKGASVIAMFEEWVGMEEFRKGVRGYLQRYAYRSATAGDFLDAVSSAGKDVIQPFSSFLDQPGLPVVSVSLDCSRKSPVLHLEQSRFVLTGSKPATPSAWKLPVCVRYGAGRSENACTLLRQEKADLALSEARSCPEWVEANAEARGYYLVDYSTSLLASLSGARTQLSAAERADLLTNARVLSNSARLPKGEALRLAERFHDDPEWQVVDVARELALSVALDFIPDDLQPNYRRFLLKSYQSRAHEMGWVARPGETEDTRLLRPILVAAVAMQGGDKELARQARDLAERWLKDRTAVQPDVLQAVLRTAAYYGDAALYRALVAQLEKAEGPAERRIISNALLSFRDRDAIEFGLEELLAGRIALTDGIGLLMNSGMESAASRKVPFEFLKAHLDQLMAGNPNIFGFSLGARLPFVGARFCDEPSKQEFLSFFKPLTAKYDGSELILNEVVESVDRCIAIKHAESRSVREFLQQY